MLKWLKEKIEDIKWHWHDKIGTLYSWWDNLCRICDFIPVLWKNWDFDARPGLYRVMRKKLERLEPCLRNGYHVHGERDAKQVRMAIFVLTRLIEDKYEKEAQAPVDEKWGKLKTSFGEPNELGCSQMFFNRENANTPEEKEQARKDFLRAMKHADDRQRRDIEWVFNFIARKHLGWWD